MLEIRSKLAADRSRKVEVQACLRLPFERRQRSRLRACLDSGEEVAVLLPRGAILRGGDLLEGSDGRIIEVVAELEPLLHVTCDSPTALARCAYHLGNRHVPIEVGGGWLRLALDHVLKDMLVGLGAEVTTVEAPFEPEAGAYGAVHSHAVEVRASRIHNFAGKVPGASASTASAA
jgi:urease accessory protein